MWCTECFFFFPPTPIRNRKKWQKRRKMGPTSFGSCGCVRRRRTYDKSPGTATASRPTPPGREVAACRWRNRWPSSITVCQIQYVFFSDINSHGFSATVHLVSSRSTHIQRRCEPCPLRSIRQGHYFRLISSKIQAKANLLLPFSIGPTVLGCMSDTSAFLIEYSKGIKNKRNAEGEQPKKVHHKFLS